MQAAEADHLMSQSIYEQHTTPAFFCSGQAPLQHQAAATTSEERRAFHFLCPTRNHLLSSEASRRNAHCPSLLGTMACCVTCADIRFPKNLRHCTVQSSVLHLQRAQHPALSPVLSAYRGPATQASPVFRPEQEITRVMDTLPSRILIHWILRTALGDGCY